MARHRVTFVHASPAALPPIARYYSSEAPDLEITNLLDDGLLRSFRSQDWIQAEKRLGAMLELGVSEYRADLVMLTCSAVPATAMEALRATSPVQVLKIDEPMAEQAVARCERLGVVVSFRPTLETTTRLLETAAARQGRTVSIDACVVPEALQALLNEDFSRHDALLIPAIEEIASHPVDGVVLAQVSMARVLPEVEHKIKQPVFNSLTSSLSEIRRILAGN